MNNKNAPNFGPNYGSDFSDPSQDASKGHFDYRQHSARNSFHESAPVNMDQAGEDNDSNSSSRTLGSSQESATITSSDTDDPNWKGKSRRKKERPLSEALPRGDSASNSVRLRSHSHPHQLREHRTSADVYMMEDAVKNMSRYTASPKQYVSGAPYSPYYVTEQLGAGMYPNAYPSGHLHEKSLSNMANYQMMQRASNYANFCRLGCDCMPGYIPCHSSMLYDSHLALNSPPYWDCAPSSVPNSVLLASGSLANHPLFSQSTHSLGPLATPRKVLSTDCTLNHIAAVTATGHS